MTKVLPKIASGAAYSAKIPARPLGVKLTESNVPAAFSWSSTFCKRMRWMRWEDVLLCNPYLDHEVVLHVDQDASYVGTNGLSDDVP